MPCRFAPSAALVVAALLGSLFGCGGADLTPEPGVPSSQRDYLVSPLEGYDGQLEDSARLRIETAHRDLLESGDPKVAEGASGALLSLDPQLAPAQVLAAQGDFVARRYAEVVARLGPRIEDSTTAGLLVLGRAAELDGMLPPAYDAYRRAADRSPVAARRAKALQERARDALMEEFDASLESARFADASAALALLESWMPDTLQALDARRRLAYASSDLDGELAVLRRMAETAEIEKGAQQADLEERLGFLELELGEPRRGLEIFEDLVRRRPGDPHLEELLAQAKFLWRLEMLPPDVQELAQRGELKRGDFATLLYWLVPNVRSGSSSEARIATDILDHPQRDAIVRVLNLGLMQAEDDTLHRFAPDLPVVRGEALEALLRIPLAFGDDVPCVRDLAVLSQVTSEFVCRTAVRCGVVPSTEDCLLAAPLGGREAMDMVRRALVLLGEG